MNVRKSVTTRILVIMIAVVVTGMGLIAVIGNLLAGQAVREQSLGRIEVTTELSSETIEAWVIRQAGYIDAMAADFSSIEDISPEILLPTLIISADQNDDFFSVYAGYPDGVGVFNDGWEPDYNEWRANERDWYKGAAASPRDVYITDLYIDAESGNFCITFSKVFTRKGMTAGVVAVDIFTNILEEVVSAVDVGQNSYAFLTDSDGNLIVYHDERYLPAVNEEEDTVFFNISDIDNNRYAGLKSSEVLSGGTIKITGSDGIKRYYTARSVSSTGWILYTAIPVNVVDAPIYRQIRMAAIVFVVVLAVAVTLTYLSLRKIIVQPVNDVAEAAKLLARGETGVSLRGVYVGEIAMLAESFYGMEQSSKEQTEWLESIAAGDLTVKVHPRGDSDRIGQAIAALLNNLNEMFASINEITNQVAMGSKGIADGAQLLAAGTSEQAESVEDLSSAIGNIMQNTGRSAGVAKEATDLSRMIRDNAEKGSVQMDSMMQAIGEINEASTQIGKVIKVIDDIAFQTNILALNAAVEAARAGQHGKGFAVVAEEVRNLATKSAEAAKDTGTLIEDSAAKADLGLKIATETAGSLREIVDGIIRSAEIVGQIAQLSEAQVGDITHVNSGIERVSGVVRQNSATAEQSAAASEQMSAQASTLKQMISQFRIDNVG